MEAFMVIAMLAALGAAWLMEIVGLSMALGAFLMGMMLSESEHRHQVETFVKILILFALGIGFGLGRSGAIRVATILPQCGEFGFVLFGAAKVAGLVADFPFTIGLLTISISMALTPLLSKAGDIAARRLEQRSEI
jgi:glutathione-regulated potassium-efflux system protein KefB